MRSAQRSIKAFVNILSMIKLKFFRLHRHCRHCFSKLKTRRRRCKWHSITAFPSISTEAFCAFTVVASGKIDAVCISRAVVGFICTFVNVETVYYSSFIVRTFMTKLKSRFAFAFEIFVFESSVTVDCSFDAIRVTSTIMNSKIAIEYAFVYLVYFIGIANKTIGSIADIFTCFSVAFVESCSAF